MSQILMEWEVDHSSNAPQVTGLSFLFLGIRTKLYFMVYVLKKTLKKFYILRSQSLLELNKELGFIITFRVALFTIPQYTRKND